MIRIHVSIEYAAIHATAEKMPNVSYVIIDLFALVKMALMEILITRAELLAVVPTLNVNHVKPALTATVLTHAY